jgi:cell pole-organizing protein PopZ
MVAQGADGGNMDDIMSSIRSSVEEEQEKVANGEPSAHAQDAMQDGDDVLELTPDEMLQNPAQAEPPVDIAAFGSTGEVKPAQMTAETAQLGAPTLPAGPAAESDAADEFDRLLAEISNEKERRVAEVEAQKAALLAEDGPLGDIAKPVAPELPLPEVPSTSVPVGMADAPLAVPSRAAEEGEAPAMLTPSGAEHGAMSATMSADGMRLVLPAEVLAMALRPMVQDWLNANLAGVVERLVQAEIAKLNQ